MGVGNQMLPALNPLKCFHFFCCCCSSCHSISFFFLLPWPAIVSFLMPCFSSNLRFSSFLVSIYGCILPCIMFLAFSFIFLRDRRKNSVLGNIIIFSRLRVCNYFFFLTFRRILRESGYRHAHITIPWLEVVKIWCWIKQERNLLERYWEFSGSQG